MRCHICGRTDLENTSYNIDGIIWYQIRCPKCNIIIKTGSVDPNTQKLKPMKELISDYKQSVHNPLK